MSRICIHYGQKFLEPFAETLEKAGCVVEMVREQDSFARLEDEDARHLVWGWRTEIAAKPPEWGDALRRRKNVWFAEQGWFPQTKQFYIDSDGPNALSSIRGAANGVTLTDANRRYIRKRLHSFHLNTNRIGEGYIYVPLQIVQDTTIRYWSNIQDHIGHKVLWFAERMCEVFAGEKIVLRAHPHDRGTLNEKLNDLVKRFDNVTISRCGTSKEWAAGAKAVVGINSTVLLEALTFNKPVAALGEGIFSGNGVVYEADGNVEDMRKVLDMPIDTEQIAKFLHVLFSRQIPIHIQPEHFTMFPQIVDLIAGVAKPGSPALIPAEPKPMDSRTDVWSFIEYPDLPDADALVTKISGLPSHNPDVKGILLNDLCLEDWHREALKPWMPADTEVIPMYSEDLNWPHMRRLDRAKSFSGKVALGNGLTHEWSGDVVQARRYLAFAKQQGFEWVCTMTHHSLVTDMKNGGHLRALLAEEQTPIFCLCGNVLIGYVFDLPTMPGMNDTSLTGHNLNRKYGLTVPALRKYCQPLNIFTGSGGPRGLALGSRVYAERLGFKGVLCWAPFGLDGTMDVEVKDASRSYPAKCAGQRVGIGDDHRKE